MSLVNVGALAGVGGRGRRAGSISAALSDARADRDVPRRVAYVSRIMFGLPSRFYRTVTLT